MNVKGKKECFFCCWRWRNQFFDMTRTFKTDHFSHSSQNLMGESQEHWSLHVADFVYDHPPVFFLFAKVFLAVSSLVSLPHDFYPNCQGGSWMYCPFLKCCTVMSTYTSQKPLLWFALLFFTPTSLTFNMKLQLLPALPEVLKIVK